MDALFWRGRRVFVTGHTGFKGSWLCIWLQSLGAEVTGYALEAPTNPSLFEQADIAAKIHSITGDVRNFPNLRNAIEGARPEVVIHMAAQPLVRHSYEFPIETYASNVMGTVHLLEAVRQVPGIKAVVNVTTDKCYENKEWTWGYRENEPLGGYDPYSSSKACSELVTAAYRSSFFNPEAYAKHGVAVATARAGNVIGGGDWAKNRLIPDLISAFENNRPALIRNPLATRPWQHVLEPLRGYLLLAERLVTEGAAFADAWNFGPADDDARSVEWIVRKLERKWGGATQWKQDTAEQPHEANYLRLDISKAVHQLKWRPVLNLEQALDLIVDWNHGKNAGRNIFELTREQVDAYQAIASADQ